MSDESALTRLRQLDGIVAEFAVDFCALPIYAPSGSIEALVQDVLRRHPELSYLDRVHVERGIHVYLNSPPWVQVAGTAR